MTTEDEPVVVEGTRDVIMGQYKDGTLAVKILIEPKDIPLFMKGLGEVGASIFIIARDPKSARQALQTETIQRSAPAVEPTGSQLTVDGHAYRRLRLYIDWMCNPTVWGVFGTDADFLAWLRLLPCASCGKKPRWEGEVFVHSEPAHVRRVANGAGTAIKPPYSAIPLCRVCHGSQTDHGESVFAPNAKAEVAAMEGKAWMDKQRIKYMQEWLWSQMHKVFGVESMKEVAPSDLLAYAREWKIDQYLPGEFRGTNENQRRDEYPPDWEGS